MNADENAHEVVLGGDLRRTTSKAISLWILPVLTAWLGILVSLFISTCAMAGDGKFDLWNDYTHNNIDPCLRLYSDGWSISLVYLRNFDIDREDPRILRHGTLHQSDFFGFHFWYGLRAGSGPSGIGGLGTGIPPCWIYRVGAPSLVISPILFVPIVLKTVSALRHRSRMRSARCPTCGYDLRVASERCPECGTEAAGKKTGHE